MDYGDDIYTEAEGDPNTLANLGPLTGIAGVWEGTGEDEHPAVIGIERDRFVEHYEAHTHVVKPGEVETFHDQAG